MWTAFARHDSGLSQRDVANSLLITLSSSALVAPSYFLNPQNSVNYIVAVKVPLQKINFSRRFAFNADHADSAGILNQTLAQMDPLSIPASQAQRLGNLSVTLSTTSTLNEISHSNVQRVLNINGQRRRSRFGLRRFRYQ